MRAPELSAVGAFHPDGGRGFVAPAAADEGRCGYVDHRGAWLAAPALAYTGPFDHDGLSRFRARDGHWGYAGTDGKPVIPATFTEAGVFREGVAAARTEDGVGFIDTSGGFVVRPQCAAAGSFAPNGRRERPRPRPRRFCRQPLPRLPERPRRSGDRGGVPAVPGLPVRPGPLRRRLRTRPPRRHRGGGHRAVLRMGGGPRLRRGRGGPLPRAFGGGLRGGPRRRRPSLRAARGVLRSDGRFIPVHHLEPLTDADGWVLGFGSGTGLAAFVTRDGGVAHADRDGLDVCRVAPAADGAALRPVDPAGTTLGETTAAAGSCAHVAPPTAGRHTPTWSIPVPRSGTSPSSRSSCWPPSPVVSSPAR
ncbi:WG repeat-containing protein [Streptomyces sp. NPDC000656]|uniref:WG repeat-containing protein n=1 Tax=Streptomyces sp. NPDC000656 TaxID=3364540 RepID=UPI0036BA9F27